ncbi:hypothetical protein [Arthrobacter sp. JZ12]|nr:hypothetical protein [Arthrobacter sp. JZ12]
MKDIRVHERGPVYTVAFALVVPRISADGAQELCVVVIRAGAGEAMS